MFGLIGTLRLETLHRHKRRLTNLINCLRQLLARKTVIAFVTDKHGPVSTTPPTGSSVMAFLAAFTIVTIGAGLSACGGSRNRTEMAANSSSGAAKPNTVTTHSHTVPPGGYLTNDGDLDKANGPHRKGTDGDEQPLLEAYGNKANPVDAQAITTVVKHYYAAATAEDGATTCALLYSSLATALAEGQGVRKTCAASVSLLLKEQHKQFVEDEVATMLVTNVHVKGTLGLAVLGFRAMPEGELTMERVGDTWKVDSVLASDMP